MALYREQGVVLRTYKLGEADRIVNVLTQGRGKVRAVAKGVRRTRSRFGARLEPFSHVDLQLYEGRNLDIVTQAELITPFAAVRADYLLSACGSTMVEAVDRVAQEGERATRLFLLLLDGLRDLDTAGTAEAAAESGPGATGGADPTLVLDAFLLRLASAAGYHPDLDACASCGDPGDHRVFSSAAGGLLCRACAAPGSQALDPGVVALLRAFGGGTGGSDPPDARVRRAAAAVVHSFLSYHLGKPLRSWELVPR